MHFSYLFSPFSDGEIEVEGQAYPSPAVFKDQDEIRYLIAANAVPFEVLQEAGVTILITLQETIWIHQERLVSFELGPKIKLSQPTPFSQWPDHTSLSIPRRFVNVHTHSEFSPLDGLSKVEEIVAYAEINEQPAVAITDHGVCASHPHLQEKALASGIKPIFGLEAYFVNDRLERPVAGDKEAQNRLKNDYWHLILWAMDDAGLRNLWAMSTAAHIQGMYYHPRLDWSVLERLNEGVMASTACLRGPISVPIQNGDESLAMSNMARLQGIFGDRLYAELHVNGLPQQLEVNRELVKMAQHFSVPLIAAVDSHYPHCEDRETHQVWIAAQTNKDLQDETDLFAGGQDYHLMDRDEAGQRLWAQELSVVEAALDETVAMADRCTAQVKGTTDPPIFSRPTPEMTRTMKPEEINIILMRQDVERLTDICLANWDRKVRSKRHPESDYIERFEREMRMYIDKGFCGYFDIVADYSQWTKHKAREGRGALMGPSRGSGGACLVAYLAEITEIDPIQEELPLARFMTKGRTEPPDFDLDWATNMRESLQTYVGDRWGWDHVVRVGTHVRYKNKGVFRDLARIFKVTRPVDYKDLDNICKIIDAEEADSAGLGKAWDVVYNLNEELFAPYVTKYPWLFDMVTKLVGRLKTYGRHAAGMVISTRSPLVDWLPMRLGEDGHMISDFDMDSLSKLGLLKFDLLTIRTLDTLQMCVDLIKERRDIDINIYDWGPEIYADPQVWEGVGIQVDTMGMFQIETPALTRLVRQIKPQNMAELADVTTLVRPGPTRSGLTDTYIKRKLGLEEVSYPDPRLEEVLNKTYGCIVYQEDIINVCMILAGYTEEEADAVRKLLGKKKVEQVAAAGAKFVPACVERGMAREAAELLWNQMAEFAKYSFNRAHAFAYAVITYWTAWFKFHYTVEFITAALSTVDQKRIPDFVKEARRMGYSILPPDVNESGRGFTPFDTGVRYALNGIKGIGKSVVEAVLEGQPYKSFDDFMERKGKGCHSDHIRLMAATGAFDSLVPNRHALEVKLDHEAAPEADRCMHWDPKAMGPNGLPCGYDWASEPVTFTAGGKPKKQKPLPKKCFKGCRMYTAPPPFEPDVEPYTDDDLRDKEMEHLGVWLSSTPFDRIDPKDLDTCHTASEVENGPLGSYIVAGILTKVTKRNDRFGRPYAFTLLETPDGRTLDVPCWSASFAKIGSMLRPGLLVLGVVKKYLREEKEQLSLESAMPA